MINNPDIPNPVTLAQLDVAVSDATLRVIERDNCGVIIDSIQLTVDSNHYQRCILSADANVDLPEALLDGWDVIIFNESLYTVTLRTFGGAVTLGTLVPQQSAILIYSSSFSATNWTFRRIPSLAANNSWSGTQTFKVVKDVIYSITDGVGFTIDPNNGGIQKITLGDNRTPVAANWENGHSVMLMIIDGTAYAITWSGLPVTWVSGLSAPTLSTSGYTAVNLWMVDGVIYGSY